MNGPIVKKLSDSQLKVLRGGGCRKTRRHTTRCHKSSRSCRKSTRRSTRRTTRRCVVQLPCIPIILIG
jgi:hypothetical protein